MPHFEGDFDGNPEADDNLCLESCGIRIDQRGIKFSMILRTLWSNLGDVFFQKKPVRK